MPIIILHGDHQVAVRSELAKIMDKWQETDTKTVSIEGAKLTLAEIEEATGSQSLIPMPQGIVIEGLLTRTRSKAKQTIIDYLTKANSTDQIILVEPKTLTAAQLKSIPQGQVKSFPLPKALFKYLDQIHTPPEHALPALRLTITQDSPELCFAMLNRQIRLLLQTLTNTPMKEAPFVINKLRSQARHFSLPQLKSAQDRLLQIDRNQKTGNSRLSLQQDLEQWQLKLYASRS